MDRLRALRAGVFGVLVALVGPAWAQEKLEQPVGLVLTSKGGMLLRSGTNLPLGAKPGDILFSGDSLQSDAGGSAVFLFCPNGSAQQLGESSGVEFDNRQLRVRKGQLKDQKTAPVCILPQSERAPIATEKHYGASMEPRSEAGGPAIGGLEGRLQTLPENVRKPLVEDLARIDQAIAGNQQDLAAQIARAAVMEKAGLKGDAADQYTKILSRWPDAVWAGSRAFDDGEQSRGVRAMQPSKATLGGKTYALIVGISTYQNSSIPQLRYAHADAELFAQHLRSPRGGHLTGSEITVLTNEKATIAAIRNAIDTLLKLRAGKTDTIILFFAAHGTSAASDGYILATDSDPQDLKDTALPMSEVQALFQEKLSSVGRVVLYVDVCHAGLIGSIRGSNKINDIVSNIADENEIFGMLAGRKNQLANEGPQYGGGHGVFSLYLVEALNGAATADPNGVIDAVAVAEYVQRQVEQATKREQVPREIGNADTSTILADMNKEGLNLEKMLGPPLVAALETSAPLPGRRAANPADAAPDNPDSTAEDLKAFDEALRAGRVLPNTDRNAFTYLSALRNDLPLREYTTQENRLRVALENLGQQVLLTYLKGDEVPQSQNDFRAGADFFEAARQLTPESLLLRARQDFCVGRAALFGKDYAGGIDLLERAAKIDSGSAYPYNALGVAYLERAKYDYAVWAFRDAIKRAPYWAYPRYNLALTYSEEGAYSEAERELREAIRVAPGYSYVHYGLGLLLHKLGRKSEAESEYRIAIKSNASRPEAYVGLGAVEASFGRKSEAEQNYQTAIRLNPRLAAATHDLGLLYAKEKKPDLAIKTWEQNVALNPDFVPSRMSLAKAYRDERRYDLAIRQYQAVLGASPGYAAAIMALDETRGDGDMQESRIDEARQEYQHALSMAVSDDDRKRLEHKLRK
jgi:tetratricopeptide (TPR) repeat protein